MNKSIVAVVGLVFLWGVSAPMSSAATVASAEEQVREAYYDVLGRAPDPSGMQTYRKRVLEDDWSAGRIRDALRESDEYKNNRVDIWIRRSYQAVLGRDPDPAGLKAYRKAISEEGWSEERLRDFLRKSDEYKQKRNEIIVRRAYLIVLGRQPDPAGLKTYVDKVRDGWDFGDVCRALRDSDEYRNKK
jgi:HEAT repeat protein